MPNKEKPDHCWPGLEVGSSRCGWISPRALRGVKGLTVPENALRAALSQDGWAEQREHSSKEKPPGGFEAAGGFLELGSLSPAHAGEPDAPSLRPVLLTSG
jgi:hypothetical protein